MYQLLSGKRLACIWVKCGFSSAATSAFYTFKIRRSAFYPRPTYSIVIGLVHVMSMWATLKRSRILTMHILNNNVKQKRLKKNMFYVVKITSQTRNSVQRLVPDVQLVLT